MLKQKITHEILDLIETIVQDISVKKKKKDIKQNYLTSTCEYKSITNALYIFPMVTTQCWG